MLRSRMFNSDFTTNLLLSLQVK